MSNFSSNSILSHLRREENKILQFAWERVKFMDFQKKQRGGWGMRIVAENRR